MSKRKLLFIVDDDPFINQLVIKRFNSEEYLVEPFEYGEECIEALDRNPDMIILDYYFFKSGIKVLNGMEIYDKIKEINPGIPVVMLSGQDRGDVVLEMARKGITDYIIKDNSLISNLEKAIAEILGGDNH
ncbi:MAG TPA: response regulator [Bacteroidetes bacterium]|nr:response regulator [Bacteroidota bacterium]